MKKLCVIVALLAGCATTPGGAPPPDPVAPSPVPGASIEPLKRALSDFFTRSYLSAKFKARIVLKGSDPLDHHGEIRSYNSGILMVDMESSGGRKIRAMRLGSQAWSFDESVGDWMPARDGGLGDIGTGFQNPLELMEALQNSIGAFAAAGPDAFEIVAAERLFDSSLKPLIQGRTVNAQTSRLTAKVLLGDASLRTVQLKGRFVTEVNARSVEVECEAEVNLGPPDEKAPPMRFNDVPIPFNEEMNSSIRKLQEHKK